MTFIVPTKSFIPAPIGRHQAVCVDAINLGLQEDQFRGGQRQVGAFVFELAPEAGLLPNGQRFTCREYFKVSKHEHAKLRALLSSWRGRDLTEAEKRPDGLDLEQMIGEPATVVIMAGPPNKFGEPTSRVQAILPPDSKTKVIASGEYRRQVDRAKTLEAPPLPSATGTLFDIDAPDADTWGA